MAVEDEGDALRFECLMPTASPMAVLHGSANVEDVVAAAAVVECFVNFQADMHASQECRRVPVHLVLTLLFKIK